MFIEVHGRTTQLINTDYIIRVYDLGGVTRIVLAEPEIDEHGAVNSNWITVKESYEEIKEKICG